MVYQCTEKRIPPIERPAISQISQPDVAKDSGCDRSEPLGLRHRPFALYNGYMGINKSLWWPAVEDLRIHHRSVAQKEMNKESEYKIIYSSLSLNNHSSCADGHVYLTVCHFP
jgi:hypothetical protein